MALVPIQGCRVHYPCRDVLGHAAFVRLLHFVLGAIARPPVWQLVPASAGVVMWGSYVLALPMGVLRLFVQGSTLLHCASWGCPSEVLYL